jgi:hypothetical protein
MKPENPQKNMNYRLLTFSFLLCTIGLTLASVGRCNTVVTFGISVHGFSHVEGVIVEQSNSSWIRTDIHYNGSFTLGTEAGNCILCRKYGQKILGILDYWTLNLNISFTLTDWDNIVNATVYHYGDLIEAYEIWNEPNVYPFQYGYLNVSNDIEHYVTMLKNASSIIKGYNASLGVIGGALSDIYDYPVGDNWEGWFTGMLDLGADSYVDAWSIHLYAGQNEEYALTNMRGNSSRPIWVTETGYSVAVEGSSEEYQAQWLHDRLTNIMNSRVLPDMVFVYTLSGDYGLLTANGSKRPSYSVFVDFAYAGSDCGSSAVWCQNLILFGLILVAVVVCLIFAKRGHLRLRYMALVQLMAARSW